MKIRLALGIVLVALIFTALAGCSNDNIKEERVSEFISFTTEDIYGQEITEEIFKDYDLTMVNIWGTFCPPCVEEMPHLGEIQKEYQEQGVNVVGLLVDVQDQNLDLLEDKIELAKEIADATGADYPHLIVSEDLIDGIISEVSGFPTSFFLDSDGNFVGKVYVGARDKEGWIGIIEDTLSGL